MTQQPAPYERTRIALFIRSLKGSGAERSMANLAMALAERGHEVDLVLAEASGPFLKDIPPTVRIVDLKVRSTFSALPLAIRRPHDFLALLPLLLNLPGRRTFGAIPALAAYLQQRRPTALLSALHIGNIAAVIARDLSGVDVRLVLSQRNHFTSQVLNAQDPEIARLAPAVRRFYPRADAVVGVSGGVSADIVEACGLQPDRVHTIYNVVAGPELDRQAQEPLDHPWFAPGQPPVILGVGKLKAQKDFPNLIRAFGLLRQSRDARLLIAGDGPDRGGLEEFVRAEGRGGDVALLGFVANPFAYMARADLFVLSSEFEGLPGVLIQALACGCPVVSTDCPSGPNEILEGGRHGPLVPVGDPAALAEAMARVLDAPPSRDDLKRRGAFFSADRAADRYLDILLGPAGLR